MKSELLVALSIGVPIGLLVVYFAMPYISPHLTPLTSRLSWLTPHIQRVIAFVKANPWAITIITGCTGLVVTAIWNHVHNIGMQKQKLAASEQIAEVTTEASHTVNKLTEKVNTLQSEKDNLTGQIETLQSQNLDATKLLEEKQDLTARLEGVTKERDRLASELSGASHVASEVKKQLEDAQKVH